MSFPEPTRWDHLRAAIERDAVAPGGLKALRVIVDNLEREEKQLKERERELHSLATHIKTIGDAMILAGLTEYTAADGAKYRR